MSALNVRCPTCGARPEWGCETREGYFRERPHEARKIAVANHACDERCDHLGEWLDETPNVAPSPLSAFVTDVLGRLEALEAAQEAHNRPLSAEQGQNEAVHVHDDERPANG